MPVTTAAALTLRRRPRRDDAAPAAQAPVHTAMTMMVIQTPMQQSGTITARTIPMITPAERKSAKQMKRYRVIHMHNGMDTEFAFIYCGPCYEHIKLCYNRRGIISRV